METRGNYGMHDLLLTVNPRTFATHTTFATSQFCPFTHVVSAPSSMFVGTGKKPPVTFVVSIHYYVLCLNATQWGLLFSWKI